MMEFFNQTICILLVIAITIIFLKTIYSNGLNNTEGFDSNTPTPTPKYYGKLDELELAHRVLKDPEFINKVDKQYKKAYHESEIGNKVIDNITLLEKAKHARGQLLTIPKKYSQILTNYKELNDKYKNQKKKIENMLIKDYNTYEDLNKFNLKNLKMKKKLQAFTDSIREIKQIQNRYTGGKILKNIATNTEFTLINNTNSGNLAQYGISGSTNEDNLEPVIYYFSVDGNCLQSNGKNDYEKIGCVSREMRQFFYIHKIKNNEMYNKYIKLSGNFESDHLIQTLETSIIYPFYIVSPFNIPGYAILNLDDKVFIRPIRNDPFQRFVEVDSSSFCEITQSS
jgi:hypothetical protein